MAPSLDDLLRDLRQEIMHRKINLTSIKDFMEAETNRIYTLERQVKMWTRSDQRSRSPRKARSQVRRQTTPNRRRSPWTPTRKRYRSPSPPRRAPPSPRRTPSKSKSPISLCIPSKNPFLAHHHPEYNTNKREHCHLGKYWQPDPPDPRPDHQNKHHHQTRWHKHQFQHQRRKV